MISIHTFELTLETNAKNFNYLLSRAVLDILRGTRPMMSEWMMLLHPKAS